MRKQNYFSLLDYLWDLKEVDIGLVVNLRQLEHDAREPIDIYINGEERFYIDVTDDGYIVNGEDEVDLEELKKLLRGEM